MTSVSGQLQQKSVIASITGRHKIHPTPATPSVPSYPWPVVQFVGRSCRSCSATWGTLTSAPSTPSTSSPTRVSTSKFTLTSRRGVLVAFQTGTPIRGFPWRGRSKSVWSDWAIFESSWWQIVLQKLPKYWVTFLKKLLLNKDTCS